MSRAGNTEAAPEFEYTGRMEVSSLRGSGPLLLDLPGSRAIEDVLKSGEYDVEITARRRGA